MARRSGSGGSGLTGNWGQVNSALYNLSRTKNYDKVLTTIGNLVVNRIKQNIMSQSIQLVPLQEEYKRRKIAAGHDPRILISTGEFLNSIVVKDVQSSGDSFSITVGVEDGSGSNGISLEELAYYIEYGTSKQPGRFPFTLSWEEMRSRVSNELINQISVTLQEGFR